MGKIITLDEQLNKVESVRNPHGGIMLDGIHVADTLKCCHCGRVWIPMKGSGNVRGFCLKCMGVTCGPQCQENCIPEEKGLEILERRGKR